MGFYFAGTGSEPRVPGVLCGLADPYSGTDYPAWARGPDLDGTGVCEINTHQNPMRL